MRSAHGKVRKSPLYTDINRQNVRALISVPSSAYKSKIVGYSRRALSSIARNKYFSTGLIPSRKHARRLTLRSSMATIPFYRTIANIDGFAESSVKLNCKELAVRGSLSAESIHAGTRVYAHARSRSTRRRAIQTTESVSKESVFAFLRTLFSPPYRRSPLPNPERHLEFNQSVCLSYE